MSICCKPLAAARVALAMLGSLSAPVFAQPAPQPTAPAPQPTARRRPRPSYLRELQVARPSWRPGQGHPGLGLSLQVGHGLWYLPHPAAALATKDELAALHKRLDELQAALAAAAAAAIEAREAAVQQQATVDDKLGAAGEDLDALNGSVEQLKAQLDAGKGAINFLPAGTTSTTVSIEDNHALRYAALFAPHFLWSFYDRALFEAHLDLRVVDGATGLNLEFAALWFVVNDSLILGAGKFLTPFGFYNEQIHTTWLNRLPDEPLAVADHVGPSPTHTLGLQARGAFSASRQRLVWAAYLGSAPVAERAAAPDHSHVPPDPVSPTLATGALDFDRYHRWALGGRLGYLPIPSLELGYSLHLSRVDPVDSPLGKILVVTHGADLNYNAVLPALKGTLDAHLEWVLSDVRPSVSSDWPSDTIRQGLYAQAAYRPSELDAHHLSRLEPVVRFDRLDGLSGAKPTLRYTAGLNYWVQPSIVAKAAYQLTDPDSGDPLRRIMFQLAGGF